jgi:hypothetical protein
MDIHEMFVNTVIQTLREQHGLRVSDRDALSRSLMRARKCGLSSRDCAETIAQRAFREFYSIVK